MESVKKQIFYLGNIVRINISSQVLSLGEFFIILKCIHMTTSHRYTCCIGVRDTKMS